MDEIIAVLIILRNAETFFLHYFELKKIYKTMIKMTNNLEPDIMCRRITGVDDVVQISLHCACYLLHLEVWYIVPGEMVHLLKTRWDSISFNR